MTVTRKYTCYVYGEGRKDKNFLKTLINLKKFKYHTSKWFFNYGNSSGGSAKIILEKCRKVTLEYSYDLVLCFIDLDGLKTDHPKNWKKKKEDLEKSYSDFKIIWQIDNAEDEYRKVLGKLSKSKYQTNKLAKKMVGKFINSHYWKRILKPIKEKEKEFEKQRKNNSAQKIHP